MPRIVEFQGTRHSFPDDATDEEIASVLDSTPSPKTETVSTQPTPVTPPPTRTEVAPGPSALQRALRMGKSGPPPTSPDYGASVTKAWEALNQRLLPPGAAAALVTATAPGLVSVAAKTFPKQTAGAIEGLDDVVGGLSAPANIAMLGLGGLSGPALRVALSGMGAWMLKEQPTAWKEAGKAFGEGDSEKGTRLLVNALAGAGMTGAAFAGGTLPRKTPARIAAEELSSQVKEAKLPPPKIPQPIVETVVRREAPKGEATEEGKSLVAAREEGMAQDIQAQQARQASRPAKPEVTGTPPEPERKYTSVVDEIRQRGLDTRRKIQSVFPHLSREEAGALRNLAFPQAEKPAAPAAQPEIPNAQTEVTKTSGVPTVERVTPDRPAEVQAQVGTAQRGGESGEVAPREETPPVLLKPAIETPQGRVVTAKDHVGAYEKAKATGTPDTSGSKEGFQKPTGEFISREKAAEISGLPTKTEPGKLHSSDLPTTPPPLSPGKEVKEQGQAAEAKLKQQLGVDDATAKELMDSTSLSEARDVLRDALRKKGIQTRNLGSKADVGATHHNEAVESAMDESLNYMLEEAGWSPAERKRAAGEPAKAPAAKEPWQMTKAEFKTALGSDLSKREIELLTAIENWKKEPGAFGKIYPDADSIGATRKEWIGLFKRELMDKAWPGILSMKARIELDKSMGKNPWGLQHKEFIEKALREGKPVPPEVLADYPDLAKTAKPPSESVQTSPMLRVPSSLDKPGMPRPKEMAAIGIEMDSSGHYSISPGSPLPKEIEPQAGANGLKSSLPSPGKRLYTTDSEDSTLHQVFILNRAGEYDGKTLWNYIWTEGPSRGQIDSRYGHSFWDIDSELKQAPTEAKSAAEPPSAETPAKPLSVGPGLVGMGGAVPSEFGPPLPRTTGIKNASIDLERESRGLPPITKPMREKWGVAWEQAMAKIDLDPNYQDRLIAELREKPRPMTTMENAALLQREVDLRNQFDKVGRDYLQAVDDGRTADATELRTYQAEISDRMTELETATERSGTQSGRSLAARKMMMNEDFSLAKLEVQRRIAKGGERLTDAERADIQKIHNDYQAKIKALEEHLATAEQKKSEAELARALSEIKAQAAIEQAKVPPHIKRIYDRIRSTVKTNADASREFLRGKTFTLSPEVAYHLGRIAADNFMEIGENLAAWSAKMVADVGERVRPHLDMLWANARNSVDTMIDQMAGKKDAPKVKKLTQDMDRATARTTIRDRLKTKIDKGDADSISALVQKYARYLVGKGITDREALIDEVHSVLQEVLPDITRRETMDAISGYGQFSLLRKDEISVKLRDLKGQMQQLAKLDDMAEGKAPIKTGLERRIPSDIERELIAEVNLAKRKGGYEVTDPNTELKSALDTLKTRTRNRITDLQKRLDEGDFEKRERPPIQLDEQAIRLQADLRRVQRQWREGLRKLELQNRATWQKALDRFVKWERAFKLSSPIVFGKLTSAAATRAVTTTVEEGLGLGLKRLPGISEVARQAPREGAGLNTSAMAEAFTSAIDKGLKDAAQTLKTGMTDLDILVGEKVGVDRDWVNVFGQMHGMLKAPVKRAEFTYSLRQRINHALKNGLDPTDPMIQMRLMSEALDDGYRSIFMQRGFSADTFNTMVRLMEQSKKAPIAGEVSARVMRFLLPIVRVPINIVHETATGAYGLPMASARTMFHVVRGTLDKLDPKTADSIMRQWKKGSIGLGLLAIGYFNPEMVGGYDWKEKRKPGAVKTGGFQVAGVDIPRWATHAPWFELKQMGATVRHVKEQHVKGKEKGISEGMWAAGLGLIDETPFVREMVDINKVRGSESQRTGYFGELAKSTLVPQAVIKSAEWLDPETRKRRPTTFLEHIEAGIPGLRENVPVDTRSR